MVLGGVPHLLGLNEAEFINLGLVAHEVDAEDRVVALEALADHLHVRHLEVIERQVQMDEYLVFPERLAPLERRGTVLLILVPLQGVVQLLCGEEDLLLLGHHQVEVVVIGPRHLLKDLLG
jgi:hypothetical protein